MGTFFHKGRRVGRTTEQTPRESPRFLRSRRPGRHKRRRHSKKEHHVRDGVRRRLVYTLFFHSFGGLCPRQVFCACRRAGYVACESGSAGCAKKTRTYLLPDGGSRIRIEKGTTSSAPTRDSDASKERTSIAAPLSLRSSTSRAGTVCTASEKLTTTPATSRTLSPSTVSQTDVTSRTCKTF